MVWDAATGQTISTIRLLGHSVTAVALLPDGNRIVIGSRDHTAKVAALRQAKCCLRCEDTPDPSIPQWFRLMGSVSSPAAPTAPPSSGMRTTEKRYYA